MAVVVEVARRECRAESIVDLGAGAERRDALTQQLTAVGRQLTEPWGTRNQQQDDGRGEQSPRVHRSLPMAAMADASALQPSNADASLTAAASVPCSLR